MSQKIQTIMSIEHWLVILTINLWFEGTSILLRNSSCVVDALGTTLCSHALKHVCNQSNGMAKRHGWGDVETRELKSTSRTSNDSFCVFSKHSVWNVSVLFTVVCLSVTITSKWPATDSSWHRVSFSIHADLSGANARSRCVVCFGAEQHSQLSRELSVFII